MRLSLAPLILSAGMAVLGVLGPAAAQDDPFGFALKQVRASNGAAALVLDPRLSQSAQAHAEDMARNAYFSHTGLDGSDLKSRARQAGCRGGAMAENIAYGQRTMQDAFSGWMDSGPHMANMVGRSYRLYGLGQTQGIWVLVVSDGC